MVQFQAYGSPWFKAFPVIRIIGVSIVRHCYQIQIRLIFFHAFQVNAQKSCYKMLVDIVAPSVIPGGFLVVDILAKVVFRDRRGRVDGHLVNAILVNQHIAI